MNQKPVDDKKPSRDEPSEGAVTPIISEPVDDKDELTLSKCHKAHIYIKDVGFPPDEVGFNCSVCNKKCDVIANPRWGLAGELQLLIGYDITDVANKINAIADAHYQKKYIGLEKRLLDFGGWIKGHCDLHERYTSACVGCQRELRAFGIIRDYQDFIRRAIANIKSEGEK